LNTPPLPVTSESASLLLASATSWPKMTMRGLRAISSFNVALMAETIVSGLPCGWGSVENSFEVGSMSGEKTKSAAVAGSGLGARSASSAA
jgi:hypothetical protein